MDPSAHPDQSRLSKDGENHCVFVTHHVVQSILHASHLELDGRTLAGAPVKFLKLNPAPVSPLVFGGSAGLAYLEIMWQLFKEFLLFLRQEKKWWLIPLVVLLLILGAVIVFSTGNVLAPLMYPFM